MEGGGGGGGGGVLRATLQVKKGCVCLDRISVERVCVHPLDPALGFQSNNAPPPDLENVAKTVKIHMPPSSIFLRHC